METRAHARPSVVHCAYCHAEEPFDELRVCGRCKTVIHVRCFEELGACPTLGCVFVDDAAPTTLAPARVSPRVLGTVSPHAHLSFVDFLPMIGILGGLFALMAFVGWLKFQEARDDWRLEARLEEANAQLDRRDLEGAARTLEDLGANVQGYSRRPDGTLEENHARAPRRAAPRYEMARARYNRLVAERR